MSITIGSIMYPYSDIYLSMSFQLSPNEAPTSSRMEFQISELIPANIIVMVKLIRDIPAKNPTIARIPDMNLLPMMIQYPYLLNQFSTVFRFSIEINLIFPDSTTFLSNR